MTVSVITDSVASIPPALAAALGIRVVSLYINEGSATYADTDLDHEAFFAALPQLSTLPTSSQPSVESMVAAFRDAVCKGGDAVGVFISERMSGTIESARLAARMVSEEFPGACIEVVDSRSNSMQEGFAAVAAAKAAQAGEAIERCVQAAADSVRRTRYLFTPASLEYLHRGGRIGTASALFGQLLQIRPVLTVRNGQTETFVKVRTQGKALAEIAKTFAADVAAHGLKEVVVHYIGDREPAQRFAAEQIEPIAGRRVEVVPVSPVVGLHVGPAIGLVYEAESDLR